MSPTARNAGSLVIASLLLATACSGDSAGEVSEVVEPVPATETSAEAPTAEIVDAPTVEPTPEPTAARAVVSDTELIAAAVAAFDAQPEPSDLMAWDHLDASVLGSNVRLEVCGWTRETPFDSLRTIEYLVEPDTDGELQPELLFESAIPGDCLNRELVESALATTRAYDLYWGTVLDDPTSFDPIEAAEFKTAGLIALNTETVAGWNRDNLHWEGHSFDGELPGSAVVDILWRRFQRDDDLRVLEVMTCREHDAEYGLYQDELLIDNFQRTGTGMQVIRRYQLTLESGQWRMNGLGSNAWADCTGFGDGWLEAINDWQPEPTPWMVLDVA